MPALIREIVEAQEGARFDRSHFAKHGAAALDFETVYAQHVDMGKRNVQEEPDRRLTPKARSCEPSGIRW